ncbi:hypothetical protein B9Z55_015431 [Caenorhabditis nigoni]|uniref:Uncharacterized protein n=1 Tax=Caenorhabditis nigoni TaxID=1611254 RepID=A0A2G5UA70_9PELO|nr:hypothetical protein B9Z55_015431 [Caenorhabditis nigoni]
MAREEGPHTQAAITKEENSKSIKMATTTVWMDTTRIRTKYLRSMDACGTDIQNVRRFERRECHNCM